jgi:hypothetical protein
MIRTSHSVSYLSEGKTENWSEFPNALLWVIYYSNCNKILQKLIDKPIDNFVNGKTESYLQLTFKSENQLKHFLRKANTLFPYVEFV